MPVGPQAGSWGCQWGLGWVPPHWPAGSGSPGLHLDFVRVSPSCQVSWPLPQGVCQACRSPQGVDKPESGGAEPSGMPGRMSIPAPTPCSKGEGQPLEGPISPCQRGRGARLGRGGPDPTPLPLDSLLLLFWGLFCKLNIKQLLLCLDCPCLGQGM